MAQAVQRLGARIPHLVKATGDFATPKLKTVWKYARVELRPPTPAEFPAVQTGFNNLVKSFRTQKWKQLTVKEAAVNTMVTIEVLCWFTIGECIGKGSVVGYQVPGAVNFEAHV